jgi:curli biogenesis system outer membrane secretion channel CsgG|tara:strand:- start:4297 stop:5394 length:1098 start_codon:yes stop_codon:yes gene_type:complete
MFKYIGIFLLTLLLVSCAGKPDFDVRSQPVLYKELTEVKLPKGDPIIIAVYDFLDMTGQKKPGGNFASMSTAVTQGSYQLLIKALQDAGDGKWFRIVERASLPSLLQERKLIRSTRQQVNGEGAEPLPPLLFAGAYITGGIVGYDSDVKTGGFGARILGIQAHKQWRQDVVTIILRLVNVQTGEVVVSLTVEKTIISGETGSDIFKYLDTDTMLVEIEAGVARNEPVTYAVRKAIEKGVVELINEGAEKGLWEFEIEEIVIEPTKDLKVIVDDITVDMGEVKPEKTYEDYLEEKEAAKEERKKLIQIKLACEKDANASGKVSKECTDLIDEKDWDDVDKETEKVEENKSDEKDINGDSDSSSDNN